MPTPTIDRALVSTAVAARAPSLHSGQPCVPHHPGRVPGGQRREGGATAFVAEVDDAVAAVDVLDVVDVDGEGFAEAQAVDEQ